MKVAFEQALEQARRGLSERHMQVLRSTAHGLSAAETGRELGLSTETVRTYRSHVIAILNARNMTQAVHHAHLLNILP